MDPKIIKTQIFPKTARQGGFAMLTSVVFFIFILLAITGGLVSPTVRGIKIASDLLSSRQSEVLSESGIEDVYYRLKSAIPVDSTEVLTLNGHTATTGIIDSGYNEKTITTLGDVSSRQRTNEVILGTGDGASFKYGIQAGTGGFVIGNATINGNVYANGNIEGSNGATITGSAFAAGDTAVINNVDVGTSGVGDIRANTVTNSTVQGNLYCQSGSGNNKSCNTSLPNPPPVGMPLTDAMINQWKADAELGGTVAGDLTISTPTTLGPKKITGNLAINANLTITGTLYVVGNITTNNNAEVRLDSSYGPTGGIVVGDGRITLSNNVMFYGSGSTGSYILMTTTSTCPSGCSGSNAIEVLNNVGAILISAQNGTVHLNNNVELSEVVGQTIIIDNSATVNYVIGLANLAFTSGPSGGWTIKQWQEIE